MIAPGRVAHNPCGVGHTFGGEDVMTRRHSGRSTRTARKTGTVGCALIALTAALALYLSASTPTALAATCAGSTIDFVAHEDDSILFHDPQIPREIAAGRCVRTVFLTAGDAGLGSSYWLGREAGVRAAYAEMMNVSNTWSKSDAGVAGHPIPLFASTATPRVSLAFMRLPDGNKDGSGFSATGNRSLQKLWLGSVPSLTALDGTSSYTRSDLISVLRTLMISAGADRVLTQDFVGPFGDSDHSDHHATAYFTRTASRQYTTPHLLVGFQDYGIMNLPENLSSSDSQAKEATWFAYAPDDPNVCQTESSCQASVNVADWWHREYTAGAEFSGFSPTSGQPGTTVTLAGSGFTGATGVSFNGLPASFTVISDTSITARVPAGATTGFVTVTTTFGPAGSPSPFTVLGTAGSNVAAAAALTASSENTSTNQLASKTVDGFTDGAGTGDFTHEWATVGQKAGAWLNLQWSSPQTLGSITLFDRPNSSDQITGGTISFSDG
ncbi:MAG TPA: PIG-L family deacetylase, partial [Gaiellaceae bacterium]|nr:PIG-L family deacetylase [Gaiellaceae bacterium]